METLQEKVAAALDLPDEATLGEQFDALAGAIERVAAAVDAISKKEQT